MDAQNNIGMSQAGTGSSNQLIRLQKDREYPGTVYENAWEDLGVMQESWKSVHGVDDHFCIEVMRKFVAYLENEVNP